MLINYFRFFFITDLLFKLWNQNDRCQEIQFDGNYRLFWRWSLVCGVITLYYVVPPCTALISTSLHLVGLYCTGLHCTALHCTTSSCTALHWIEMQCTGLQYTIVHCSILYFVAVHCTSLQCTALLNTSCAVHCSDHWLIISCPAQDQFIIPLCLRL